MQCNSYCERTVQTRSLILLLFLTVCGINKFIIIIIIIIIKYTTRDSRLKPPVLIIILSSILYLYLVYVCLINIIIITLLFYYYCFLILLACFCTTEHFRTESGVQKDILIYCRERASMPRGMDISTL